MLPSKIPEVIKLYDKWLEICDMIKKTRTLRILSDGENKHRHTVKLNELDKELTKVSDIFEHITGSRPKPNIDLLGILKLLTANENSITDVPKWKYRVLTPYDVISTNKDLCEVLDALGEEGWEMCGGGTNDMPFIFKRQIR